MPLQKGIALILGEKIPAQGGLLMYTLLTAKCFYDVVNAPVCIRIHAVCPSAYLNNLRMRQVKR